MEKIMSQFHATPGTARARAHACRDHIEQQIIRAYVRLACAPHQANGPRTLVVAQFGALEVRLTERPPSSDFPELPPFWVEIYSHASGSVTDSCGCYEFDEPELNAAIDLVSKAQETQPPLH
jgi:hypothetical protein